jgi:hypothetical protein
LPKENAPEDISILHSYVCYMLCLLYISDVSGIVMETKIHLSLTWCILRCKDDDCYVFAYFQGGSISPWPKAAMATPNISPAKILLPSHSNPLSVNSSPSHHFPSVCLPHVVPPDPSELPLPQLIGSRPDTRASEDPEDDQWSTKASGDADKDPDHRNRRALSTAGDSLDNSNVSIEMVESGLSTPNRTRRKSALLYSESPSHI